MRVSRLKTGMCMMTTSNGNNFRVTSLLCGELTGHRLIPRKRPVTRSFDVFSDRRLNKRLNKQSWAVDFRPHHAHYDAILMRSVCSGRRLRWTFIVRVWISTLVTYANVPFSHGAIDYSELNWLESCYMSCWDSSLRFLETPLNNMV